jgi:alpha-galactosidase
LVNPNQNPMASLMFASVDKSRAVIFNYLTNTRFMPSASPTPIQLKGLDGAKHYTVKEINLYPVAKSSINKSNEYSGEFLMMVRINPNVNGRRTSVILEINEVKK